MAVSGLHYARQGASAAIPLEPYPYLLPLPLILTLILILTLALSLTPNPTVRVDLVKEQVGEHWREVEIQNRSDLKKE